MTQRYRMPACSVDWFCSEPVKPAHVTTNVIQTPLWSNLQASVSYSAAVAVISGTAFVTVLQIRRETDGTGEEVRPGTSFQSTDEATSSKQVLSDFSPEQSVVIPLDSSRRSIAAYKPKHTRVFSGYDWFYPCSVY